MLNLLAMYKAQSPTGKPILLAENISEDIPFFVIDQLPEALEFYQENGFLLFRNFLPREKCLNLHARFKNEIKTYSQPLPRITGFSEANILNDQGFVMNALMNVHHLSSKQFEAYSSDVIALLTQANLNKFARALLNGPIGLNTWNQFEGNPVTPPHHDCYFWGSDLKVGEVLGAWVALEDIHPGAGRLFVYPGSHKLDINDFAISAGHKNVKLDPCDTEYKEIVMEFLKTDQLECKAPYLRAGDILFWDARTIHGSLATLDPQFSRASFTAHYRSELGRFHPKGTREKRTNDISVSYPKFNLKKFINKRMPLVKLAYQKAQELLKI